MMQWISVLYLDQLYIDTNKLMRVRFENRLKYYNMTQDYKTEMVSYVVEVAIESYRTANFDVHRSTDFRLVSLLKTSNEKN